MTQWNKIFTQLAGRLSERDGRLRRDRQGGAHFRRSSLADAQSIFSYYMAIAPPGLTRFTRAGSWWYAAEDLVLSIKWPAFYQEVQSTL